MGRTSGKVKCETVGIFTEDENCGGPQTVTDLGNGDILCDGVY